MKNKYTKMYLKYIFWNIFHAKYSTNTCAYLMYLIKKTQLHFWYTKLVYLQGKLEQLILYLMPFNCAEVVLKSN